MNYSIFETQYRYVDTCFQDLSKTGTNVTVTVGGHLSDDATSPGALHEGFVLLNHSIDEKPNMLFNVSRDADGHITLMHFYACLGHLVPGVGKELFSYLVYSRDPHLSSAEINELVDPDRARDVFDLDGLVITNASTWRECQVL